MSKTLILILLSVNLFSLVLADGPYNVDLIYESDGLRNGPYYSGATLYYPIDAPEPFASIVIVPGWGMPESTIQDWGPFFASWGIVAMTIGTNNPNYDWPEERAEALLDAIETIKQEDGRINSPVYGKIDLNSFAVSGWSMGGGGAQLAAVMEPTLKAVIALCPWLDNWVLGPDDLNHSVPILIFSGENDVNAPPYLHADIHYNYTPSATDKLLFEVENGDHYVANGPDGGSGYIGDRAHEWLKKYLLDDFSNCELLLEVPPTASQYLTNIECESVIQGDLNGDGVIDILDIIILVNMILNDEYNSIADLNEDGELNILDLVIMVNLVLYGDAGACIDIDGNVYETVQIGDQLWMAENLKVTHFNDGSEITHIINSDDWGNYNEGQYGVYDNDPSNAAIYGNLYNWYAVDDDRGVCPEGFHAPSDEEFMELEIFLGMSESEANSTGNRGTNEGSKLADNADLWISGNLENNAEFGMSGFNGLPAGHRLYDNGYYSSMGNFVSYWSSTEHSSNYAWNRELEYHASVVYRFYATKQFGFSIRCLGD